MEPGGSLSFQKLTSAAGLDKIHGHYTWKITQRVTLKNHEKLTHFHSKSRKITEYKKNNYMFFELTYSNNCPIVFSSIDSR